MAHFLGFEISPQLRTQILSAFPPIHDRVVCDHITLCYGSHNVQTLLADPRLAHYNLLDEYDITVLKGYSSPIVQCVTVWVNGESLRPDHKMFHCTVSVDSTRGKPAMSNDIIMDNSLCSDIKHLLTHNITGTTKLKTY